MYDPDNLTTNAVHHRYGCADAVLRFFGTSGVTYNTRTRKNVWQDTLRRSGWAVRSRMSKLRKAETTVGGCRQRVAEIAASEPQIKAFVVQVHAHVLILDREGNTVVDTAPRKRDRRQIKGLMAVM